MSRTATLDVAWHVIPGDGTDDDPDLHIAYVPFRAPHGLWMASPPHIVFVDWSWFHEGYRWLVDVSEGCNNRWRSPDNPIPEAHQASGEGTAPTIEQAKADALAWLVAHPYSQLHKET